MSSNSWNKYFESDNKKYVYAAAAVITIGGCFLVYKAYQDQNAQKNESGLDMTNRDALMSSVKSGANSIAEIDVSNAQITNDGKSFPIQVFVRMRPMVGREIKENHLKLDYELKQSKKSKKSSKNKNKKNSATEEVLVLNNVAGRDMNESKQYKGFQNVLLPVHNNFDTFNTCVLPYLGSIFAGQKTCCFAYGHTGSGKTHTIFGYGDEHPGMFQLYARALFKHLKEYTSNESKENETLVEVRFTELYDNKLRDLLSPTKTECFIRETRDGEVHIRSTPVKSEKDGKQRQFPITAIHCKDEESLMNVVREGVKSRNVGISTLHDKSSRSHAFLEYEIVNRELMQERRNLIEIEADILNYKLKLKDDKAKKCEEKQAKIEAKVAKMMKENKILGGTMVFVDLAGNEYGRDVAMLEESSTDERKEKTAEEMAEYKKRYAQEQKERNQINQSLLALKECIRALHANKKHVGFRNSKLTQYLSQYLKANSSNAIMISNIGSSGKYAKQTINTLKYTQLVANA